jgi:hypothetical protein
MKWSVPVILVLNSEIKAVLVSPFNSTHENFWNKNIELLKNTQAGMAAHLPIDKFFIKP